MRTLKLTALALWLALPAWAAQVQEAVSPVAQAQAPAPLAQLGAVLSQSLPILAAQNLAVPSLSPAAGTPELVVPAAFDVQKAQILLSRAALTPGNPIPAERQDGAQRTPQDVIAAVNATLKDFTPEQLQKMPTEDLHGLSSVIIDQLQGQKTNDDSRGVALIAEARTQRMLERRGQPLDETLMNPRHTDNHPDDISVRGVPNAARLVLPTAEAQRENGFRSQKAVPIEKDTVFRHYTTKEGFDAIMGSKSFWNGFVPYVQLSRGTFKKTFRDVAGLFFTLPKVSGDSVGVPERDFNHYVDVLIPKGFPLMELEAGAIYMIPLPGRTREWVRDYYNKWTKGEEVPSHYRKMVAEMNAEGGPGPDLQVPVQIVGHGKVR